MLLQVTKGDSRPPSVQGMQDISVEEVIGVRDCVITSKPYPMLSFRDLNCSHPAVTCGMSKEEHKAILFQQGRLVCRHVHISITESTGKSYAGEVRMIYARESDVSTPASSNGETICIDSDSEDGVVVIKNRSQKRRSEPAVKKTRYTFGDVFCGVGGASQGAVQAGLHVLWGVDKDDAAIKAYHCNHTGAEIFLQDAHDFPPPNIAKISLRVDILHLSPPCCYWSPAQ
jgi:DNA (cytosine-5)-methyltransferase 1